MAMFHQEPILSHMVRHVGGIKLSNVSQQKSVSL